MSTQSETIETLQARLQQLEVESQRSAKIQGALYKVAEAASASEDLQHFYSSLHAIVGDLMYAGNFFIAVLDEQSKMVSWPYHVDEKDHAEDVWAPEPYTDDRGVTTYVLRTGKSLHGASEYGPLIESGAIDVIGTRSFDAIFVPLKRDDAVVGTLAVQSYTQGIGYTSEDVQLLTFVGQHIAAALTRARALEETRQRNAELQIINSIQQGLASKLELQGIIDLVGDKLREVLKTDEVGIRLYDAATDRVHYPYEFEHGQRLAIEPQPPTQTFLSMQRDRKPIFGRTTDIAEKYGVRILEGTERSKSMVNVPIISGAGVIGAIAVENYEREDAFNETNIRLLETIAASMGVALDNARLFDETQRLFKAEQERAAQLAIINSVQAGLAQQISLQGIYELVGEKLLEIFQVDNVGIVSYDADTGILTDRYSWEKGDRTLLAGPIPLFGFRKHVVETRQSMLINRDTEEMGRKYSNPVLYGAMAKSCVFVPILVADRATGIVTLQDMSREDAFSESDVNLLETLAGAMGVALENARLFDETQRLWKETDQRAAELAIINSVQAGLASKLDMNGIYDLVGEKIRDIFNADTASISIFDADRREFDIPYYVDQGKRLQPRPVSLGTGLTSEVYETRRPLLLKTSQEQGATHVALHTAYADPSKDLNETYLGVPILLGEVVTGVLSIQSHRQAAYDESHAQLLSTLASSMSVALENARLFDETQRLLKETDQRAAELAIINGVQEGLASRLDIQAIYDLVGEKIRDIFKADTAYIAVLDEKKRIFSFPYYVDAGARLISGDLEVGRGLTSEVMTKRSPLLLNSKQEMALHDSVRDAYTDASQDLNQSFLGVPVLHGDRARAVVSVQSHKSGAYDENDVRLLQTLSNSMSVALENARLFDETQRLLKETEQRAAELAIINSIQEALAAKLEIQGIYDAVGDRISEIFHGADIGIRIYDPATNSLAFPYAREHGQPLHIAPIELTTGITAHVFETRSPLLINRNLVEETAKLGSRTLPGTATEKSGLWVPIIVGSEARGLVELLNLDREDAFSDGDVRLLTTVANAMSVALENARLFDETQRLLKETDQRAAELAIINSVQEALASKLEIQEIYDLVGDRIREVFDAQVVVIEAFDHEQQDRRMFYAVENGERVRSDAPTEFNQLVRHLIAARQPLVINENAVAEGEKYGMKVIPGTRPALSMVFVPFGTADQVNGYFSLQNVDREHAFSDSDVRLLQTLAGGMGIALENARLFEAERKRAAELAAISTVSQALVAEAELDKMIQLIGTQLLEIFKPDVAYVALLDRPAGTIEFPFAHGDDFPAMPYGQGLSTRIIDSQQPLLINKDIGKRYEELGTVRMGKAQASSYLGVPIVAGGEAIGVISVQSTRQENAFSEDDSRLLSTIAANAGAAIQTARLHTETQRRAQEMATLAEIGNDIAGTRELEPVLERIVAHAMSIMNVRDIAITLRTEDESEFRTPVALGRYAAEMRALVVRPGLGIMGNILEAGVPEFVNDPQNDPRVVTIPGTPVVEEDPECLMGAPLISRGKVIGGLMVWRLRRNGLFTQAELDFLVSVARQTTIAIESARLYLETQRRANEMSALADVGREISASLDKAAVLELIVERAMELLAAENSAVYLLEPQGGVMRAIAVRGDAAEALREEDIRLGAGIIGSLAAEGRAEAVNDVFHDPRGIVVPGMSEPETERLMAAPLMRGDEVVGMLAVWRTTAPFNQSDLNFLIGLARQAAIAFENARLFDEVKRQGAYLETIFLNSPVAIVTVDEHDQVMSWSPAAEKLFGYASAEAVGENVDQLVANQELIRAEAVSYTEQGKHNQYVHRVTRRTRKDGTLVDVDLSALPLPLEGGKTGVVAIYNDVGEIQRQRKYYEAIVQNSPVAIVTIDQNARVQSWNPGAENLFGYPREEAIGENLDDLVAGTDDTHKEAESYNLLARNRDLHVITKRTRKDGTPVEVELSGVPLPLPSGESGLVAIYHDITELQRARQEAVAANEAKSAFLATMSHEIRTPMNAVIGMSGLLMDTTLNPEQHDYVETIRNSGDALLTIINDILDFSKIEAGKMELESQPFDLRECVESAIDLVAAPANEKGLDLAYIIEDDVPAGVRGDVTRLRQILLNLASNAVKFTERGEVVVTVKPDKEPERLLITVRDSGIGIPKDRMGRLFASFSQADSSTTRRFGGTGLGLAISKRLAEMMGGTMWAESAGVGKGATFSFTMQAQPARVATRKTVRELNGIQPALDGKRVLIVDDNATNRRILSLQTGKWGMKPSDTESPRESLRTLKSDARIDLVILDVQMPEMDGVALAREIRKLKNRAGLPVILLTSLGRKEAGVGDLDIAAFLTKPLKPSSLFDALAGIFASSTVARKAEPGKATIDTDFAREHPLRILLAEDNAVNQKLALRLLEQMGYRADVASNGVEAIESVERQAYDVILMDVQMPEMDGLDATRNIRKLTTIRQPRIIAMTANAMQGDREMCLAAGMDDYVSKPIRVAELLEALARSAGPRADRKRKPGSKKSAATKRPAKKSRALSTARGSATKKKVVSPRRAAKGR